jgi:deoxyribonuclease V
LKKNKQNIFQFIDTTQAVQLQLQLAKQVISKDDPGFNPRLVCGMDVAYHGETAYTAAAVYDFKEDRVIETEKIVDVAPTKYLSGFLSFREGPILMKIVEQLQNTPDVYLIDGHGRSHPRRCGIACQIGLALDKPTIGVAKSYLYGKIVGDKILDPQGNIIGRILTSPSGKKFFVSVGNRISLRTAVKIVRETFHNGHPLPLRRAHLDSIMLKREHVMVQS